METEQKFEEIRRRLDRLGDYQLDQRELGKIMIIVSTTLFMFSAHAALSFRSAAESVESLNSELDTVSGIINSGSFQDSIDVIRSLNSNAISRQVDTALNAFQSVENSVQDARQVEKGLRSNYQLYQWLALVGILGDVAGIAIIYL